MPVRKTRLQPVEPIHTEARALVAVARMPERNIGLVSQIFQRSVIAVVVHHQKMVNAHVTVILQKIG